MSAQEPEVDRSSRPVRLLAGAAAVTVALAAVMWRLMVDPSAPAQTQGAGARSLDAGVLALYMWIAIGSALGGMARFWFSGIAVRFAGATFPWGTLAINILGSFVIGFFATLTGPDGRIFVSSTARQFVMIGICGGFTTFSSFSLQTLNLLNDGEWGRAMGNIAGSLVLCLAAVWAGYALAASLNLPK